MAKVEYADAIKTISGALTKINKKSAHAQDEKMVLCTHRKAATTNPNCNNIYLRGLKSVTRPTLPSSNELDARERFTAVAQAVTARRKDLTKITTDQINFRNQRDLPGGKKTMRSYLWKIVGDEYDAAHPRG